MYDEATKKGGWVGWKEFTVAKKVKESDEVVSLYLEPKEPRQLLPYHPGQYIAVSLYIPSLGYKQARQYVQGHEMFRISFTLGSIAHWQVLAFGRAEREAVPDFGPKRGLRQGSSGTVRMNQGAQC